MKRVFLRFVSAGVWSFCVIGCVDECHVIITPRVVPEYPQTTAVQAVPANVKVAIYPPPDAGAAEVRKMYGKAHAALEDGMKAAGYGIVPPDITKADEREACVVELAECRHDTPEWNRAGEVSVVTVVAVCVRKPGAVRNGGIDCGGVRSFQGVYRMKLGVRPLTFTVSDDELAKGVKGAVDNLIGAAPFREAVGECGKGP